MLEHLRRIPQLATLSANELSSLVPFSTVLCLPRERWIVRADRRISNHLYLLRGEIQIFKPDRRECQRGRGELAHFYPGSRAARTMDASQILSIDSAAVEFLVNRVGNTEPQTTELDPWLALFLDSPMVRCVPVSDWSRIVDAFRPTYVRAGRKLIAIGEPADRCFVVATGRALVHRAGRALRELGPGDFFGEDAFLLRSTRTAEVTALEHLRVLGIDARVFARVIRPALLTHQRMRFHDQQLALDRVRAPHEWSAFGRRLVQELDPSHTYCVTGGAAVDREFIAFTLNAQGLSAYVGLRKVNADEDSRQESFDLAPSDGATECSLPSKPILDGSD